MKPDDSVLSGRERGDPETTLSLADRSHFCGGCDYCCRKATQIGQQIEVSGIFPSL
jgi:hypothetical protein